MSEVNFTFRCDQELKEQFVAAAKGNDRNASQLLREYMRRYLDLGTGDNLPAAADARQPATATR